MAKVENWRRWIDLDQKKSVVIGGPTHRKLQQVSQETGMSMQFWGDAALRFFFAHTLSQRLIDSAKGVTLEAYNARVRAVDEMIFELIESGAKVPHAVSPVDEPPPPPAAKEPEQPTKAAHLAEGALRLARVREQRRLRRRQEMSQNGALGGANR